MTTDSPFLKVPESKWLACNALAFAFYDGFPVSPGHTLVVTRRVVATWFDASNEEREALMALVGEVRELLDAQLAPDGYNVGFNSGEAAGQTVPHLHVHVIPRYRGDVPDPRGGVRYVIPEKANYLIGSKNATGTQALRKTAAAHEGAGLALSTGHPGDPLWDHVSPRLFGAKEIDVVASFVQMSGLDVIEESLFAALREGARVRILVGDYLCISDPCAVWRLFGWMQAAVLDGEGNIGSAKSADPEALQVGLVELRSLEGGPASFHPKAWRIVDESGGWFVVGSSNLSGPALRSGVEWNLMGSSKKGEGLDARLGDAFADLWRVATPLTAAVAERYAATALKVRRSMPQESETVDVIELIPSPRPWQVQALAGLSRIRSDGHGRALVAVATGLGKTWLAAFDVLAFGTELGRRPRVLVVAHRAEILVQTEQVLRRALESQWPEIKVGWYLQEKSSLLGDLVIASVQKLSRAHGLRELAAERFDYVVIDEVHHAEAPSYRRVMARLNAAFVLGLTATPERGDGVDVAVLFDDLLAWHATIGDGIEEGSLVPFHYELAPL